MKILVMEAYGKTKTSHGSTRKDTEEEKNGFQCASVCFRGKVVVIR
jgi:hypothetical protein